MRLTCRSRDMHLLIRVGRRRADAECSAAVNGRPVQAAIEFSYTVLPSSLGLRRDYRSAGCRWASPPWNAYRRHLLLAADATCCCTFKRFSEVITLIDVDSCPLSSQGCVGTHGIRAAWSSRSGRLRRAMLEAYPASFLVVHPLGPDSEGNLFTVLLGR